MKNIISIMQGSPEIIAEDFWKLVLVDESPGPQPCILPLASWIARVESAEEDFSACGVWLGPDDEVEKLQPWFPRLPIIAIQFASFRDGRGYTQAYMLRSRLGWRGELRAFGDVLRDQLSHMRQCGFTSFAVREDKSVVDAVKGLGGVSVLYGNSAIEPLPLFRRKNHSW